MKPHEIYWCSVCEQGFTSPKDALLCEWQHTKEKWSYKIRSLIGQDPEHPEWPGSNVKLKCPETGNSMATEYTTPEAKDGEVKGGTLSTYACAECGAKHQYLWGPPAPLYVGDKEQ